MKIKLETRDKVALWGLAVIIYSVWIIPTAVVGWLWYLYRDKLKKAYLELSKESTIDKIKSMFKS